MGRWNKRCEHRNKIVYPKNVADRRAKLWGWSSYECPIDSRHWHVSSKPTELTPPPKGEKE